MLTIKNKINLSIFITTLMVVGTLKSTAQTTEFGLRYMPTFSSFSLKTSSGGTITGDATLGYGIGVFLGFNLTEHIGIQGEVIYSSIAQKYKEQDLERKINLKYFNIPLLVSLNTGKTKRINFNVVVGPQIGISAGSSDVATSNNDGTTAHHAVLSVKKGDLGFAYGAGLDFGISPSGSFRIGLGYRGAYGLLDISDNSTTLVNDSYYLLDRTHVRTDSAYLGLSLLF